MGARTQRSERSREIIIAAAADALVDGNGDFELQDVARRAGVSISGHGSRASHHPSAPPL